MTANAAERTLKPRMVESIAVLRGLNRGVAVRADPRASKLTYEVDGERIGPAELHARACDVRRASGEQTFKCGYCRRTRP